MKGYGAACCLQKHETDQLAIGTAPYLTVPHLNETSSTARHVHHYSAPKIIVRQTVQPSYSQAPAVDVTAVDARII